MPGHAGQPGHAGLQALGRAVLGAGRCRAPGNAAGRCRAPGAAGDFTCLGLADLTDPTDLFDLLDLLDLTDPTDLLDLLDLLALPGLLDPAAGGGGPSPPPPLYLFRLLTRRKERKGIKLPKSVLVPTSALQFGIDNEETWRKSLQSRPPLEVGESGVRLMGRPESGSTHY